MLLLILTSQFSKLKTIKHVHNIKETKNLLMFKCECTKCFSNHLRKQLKINPQVLVKVMVISQHSPSSA